MVLSDKIDLTTNRDFRRPTIHRPSNDLGKNELSDLQSIDVIFPTGDKNSIILLRRIKQLMNAKSGSSSCERCGAVVKNIPWRQQRTLCLTCSSDLEERYGSKALPWQMENK